jgi:hypothetical protein
MGIDLTINPSEDPEGLKKGGRRFGIWRFAGYF